MMDKERLQSFIFAAHQGNKDITEIIIAAAIFEIVCEELNNA